MSNRPPDYPILFHIARYINLFCIIVYIFCIVINWTYVAVLLLIYLHFWVFIILSIIEIRFVINGDKELFNRYRKENIFFLGVYFITAISILIPIIGLVF